ncbi:polymorphic toxin type 25 domain-containing protein [Xenorhabdus sp. KJ12.1]|uniref:polymorphic toxin type 25 domain-containing protein n=1 Tax=Xenorhabdus sp. KJ12.1 TaxID=1851571 RepID=UPI000C049F7C|nr:polymorphic toxin type 25 domain-containing protein [Xenorhabdus sp. KJ12.1]PHM70068.1 ShlA/HecA/FhaA exofamily protein [Xenorhabdus sp. KJ12.1]
MANSVSSDASLSSELYSKGKTVEEITEAIKSSHKRPLLGVEYKVKPYLKGEAEFEAGWAGFAEVSLEPYKFVINGGETTAIGVHTGATVGVEFGPYFPGSLGSLNKDYSFDLGFGSVGLSVGKDGIGTSLGAGLSYGLKGTQKISLGEVDINGKEGAEIYKYEFKEK